MPEYYRHSSVNGWKYVWIKKYMGTDIADEKRVRQEWIHAVVLFFTFLENFEYGG